MHSKVWGSLMIAGFTALITMTWVADAAAVTQISACPQTLSKPGEMYVVTADLKASGDCLLVAADRITIDLKGHTLTGDGTSGGGIREGDRGWATTSVKNGTIMSFQYGIDLASSTRSEIRNVKTNANATNGMLLGTRVLVKGSTASGNAWYGIEALDYAVVQENVVTDNGVGGILVGDHGAIMYNRVNANVGDLPGSFVNGITAGTFSTITGNYMSDNSGYGLRAGPSSLVNANTATNNGSVGIQVACPSTVTNNKASGNDPDYELYPEGKCRGNNNK